LVTPASQYILVNLYVGRENHIVMLTPLDRFYYAVRNKDDTCKGVSVAHPPSPRWWMRYAYPPCKYGVAPSVALISDCCVSNMKNVAQQVGGMMHISWDIFDPGLLHGVGHA